MFRKLYNRAVLKAKLVPDGPVLIVEGGTPDDPTAPDLAFVRTGSGAEGTVYLPGSSLKGVLRAHAERLLATSIGSEAAEDPFDEEAPRRKAAKERREDGDRAGTYRASCQADRLFGSTQIAGRLSIADALPVDGSARETANRTEIRYGVAIDRVKGSVRYGPFEQEAVTGGAFGLRITIENFELWMLALVLQALRDLHEGFVQIGHAKTRGFGSVKVEAPHLRMLWPGGPASELRGAGACESSATVAASYGLTVDDVVPAPEAARPIRSGLFSGYELAEWESLDRLLQGLVEGPWKSLVDSAATQGRDDAP